MAAIAAVASLSYVGVLAIVALLAWLVVGPLFHWSDAFMLVGNTGMSAVSYVVLFAVLSATAAADTARAASDARQEHRWAAVELQLAELIRATPQARNHLMAAPDMTEEQQAAEQAALRVAGE